MFWGLIIEPSKRYSQNVEDSFHVSKATLDLSQANDEDVTLMLDHEGQEYILCHLGKDNKQESLDLNFQTGDSISFFSQGQAAIHLSGYHFSEEEDDMTLGDMMEEEEEEEDDEEEGVEEEQITDLRETIKAKAVKRAQPANGKNNKPGKMAKMDVDDSDEDHDDDEEEEGEEEEESKPSPPPKSKKQLKKEAAQQKAQQQNAGQQGKKNNQPAQPTAQAAATDAKADAATPKTNKKQTLPGGLVVEDVQAGKGRPAKQGDQVAVFYKGQLQKSGKVFDKCVSGKGFTFKLGAGRVIKGWDLGIVGMQIGGKRKLTIPASLAYGAGGSPPQIPPNATLVFDVELKNLN